MSDAYRPDEGEKRIDIVLKLFRIQILLTHDIIKEKQKTLSSQAPIHVC